MAGRRLCVLIGTVGLVVALAHWAVLAWLQSLWNEASVLRVMPPMVVRQLLAPATPTPPATHAHAVHRSARRTEAATHPRQPDPPNPPDAARPVSPPPQESPPPTPTNPNPESPDTAQATPPDLAPPVDSWPPDTQIHYVVGGYFRGPLHGDAHVQFQREGQSYEVKLEVSIGWLAHLSMTSQGQVNGEELRPQAFEEDSNTRRRHVRFTPNDVVLMDGTRLPRPAGVQDTASQFVELAHRFATAATPPKAGHVVSVWLARPGGADEWTYDVLELEDLQTPRMGQIQALHLKPRPLARPRGPITAEMWFAPSLQYLPVRIKIAMNNDTWVDLVVNSIEQGGSPKRR